MPEAHNTCPDCGDPLRRLPRGPGGQFTRFHRLLFGLSIFSRSIEATRGVCLSCGRLVEWVEPGELEKLRSKLR